MMNGSKCTHTHTHTTTPLHTTHLRIPHSVIRQKEKFPFATMWMKLESITLSEVSQTNNYDLTDMWNLNNKNTKKQAHINREQTVAVRGGW